MTMLDKEARRGSTYEKLDMVNLLSRFRQAIIEVAKPLDALSVLLSSL